MENLKQSYKPKYSFWYLKDTLIARFTRYLSRKLNFKLKGYGWIKSGFEPETCTISGDDLHLEHQAFMEKWKATAPQSPPELKIKKQ